MKRLFLVGPRGGGKTTVARIAAERLGWDWVDMDAEIERRAGRAIAEIFASGGEPAFRALEAEVLHGPCRRERLVIATGGGAVLRADSRRRMREAGFVVWLDADAAVLWERIRGDATTAGRRPDLAGGGQAEVERIVAEREALYRECAHARIDTTGLAPEEVVGLLLSELPTILTPDA